MDTMQTLSDMVVRHAMSDEEHPARREYALHVVRCMATLEKLDPETRRQLLEIIGELVEADRREEGDALSDSLLKLLARASGGDLSDYLRAQVEQLDAVAN